MASAYRRTFFVHITQDAAGKDVRRFVSKGEAARLKAAGERVEERPGKRWYVRYRDAAGAWHDERTTAHTKADASGSRSTSSGRPNGSARGSSRCRAIRR